MESVNNRIDQWKIAMMYGIICVIIGILLVIFKKDSLKVIIIISGIMLIINGVFALFGGIPAKDIMMTVIGVVLAALGIAMIILPNLFSDIFMVLLGILLVIMGVVGAISALYNGDKAAIERILSIAIAALMIVAGVLIFVRMNDMTNIIMIVAGVLTIIGGALEMFAAYTMYKQISA